MKKKRKKKDRMGVFSEDAAEEKVRQEHYGRWQAKRLAQIEEMLGKMRSLEDPEEGDEQRVLVVLELFLLNFPKIRRATWDEICQKYEKIARRRGWVDDFVRCTAVCLMPREYGGHDDAHFCVRELGHKGAHHWDCGYREKKHGKLECFPRNG